MSGIYFNNRKLWIEFSKIVDNSKPKNETVLYVGNLNYSTTNQTLGEFFKSCGKIKEIRMTVNNDET